jgi:hypothetical protein
MLDKEMRHSQNITFALRQFWLFEAFLPSSFGRRISPVRTNRGHRQQDNNHTQEN